MSLEERFLMMTGNNKVWRAPIAGLASVAMLATMGVAAMTANAADVEFTFDGQGLTFNTSDGETSTLIVKDGANGGALNGKLDAQEIAEADEALVNPRGEFTGWYTTANYGAVNAAVQPGVTTDKTVYAHWSDVRYDVTFNYASSPSVALAYKNNVMDKVSDWQVPTDASKTDGQLLTGWTSGFTGAAIDPTNLSTGDFMNNGSTLTLNPQTVASTAITFSTEDLWGENGVGQDGRKVLLNGKNADVVVETPLNQPFAGEVPTAAFAYPDGRVVAATQFVTSTDKKTVFDPTDVVTADPHKKVWHAATLAGESYTVKFKVPADASGYDFSDAPETQLVAEGDKVVKPADPTLKDNDQYKFAFVGWSTSDTEYKAYDFNASVTKAVDLYAFFKVSAVKVTFNVNYTGGKNIEQWYADGDVFSTPEVERDGYSMYWQWNTGSKPFDGTKLTMTGKAVYGDPSADLTYRVTAGENESDQDTVEVARNYTAMWTPVSEAEETLTEIENKVNIDANNRDDWYTDASFKVYQSDWQDYLAKKAELAKNGYSEDEYSELLQMLKSAQSKLVEVGDIDLYRVYNPNNGDHYFTTDKGEYKALVAMGWQAEGVRYQVINNRGNAPLGTAIFSVYNPNTGEHLLTEEGEADALAQVGWIKEDLKFYTVQNGSESVVRVYNPNTNGPAHLYTDASEANGLAKIGWSIDNGGAPVFTLD